MLSSESQRMTAAQAVEVVHRGYGDDCPEGGDEYLAARMVLADAGLLEWDGYFDHSTWPRHRQFVVRDPDTGELVLSAKGYGKAASMENLIDIIGKLYVTPMIEQLNKPSPFFTALENEAGILYTINPGAGFPRTAPPKRGHFRKIGRVVRCLF